MTTAVTYTSKTNAKLIHLYEKHGYTLAEANAEMVSLTRALPPER
jgi:hypothetical protein